MRFKLIDLLFDQHFAPRCSSDALLKESFKCVDITLVPARIAAEVDLNDLCVAYSEYSCEAAAICPQEYHQYHDSSSARSVLCITSHFNQCPIR